MYDYSDAYIVVRGRITIEGSDNAKEINNKLIFKDNAPLRSSILKINNLFIGNAEDLDIVMRMCNRLKYSDNYSLASRSF